MARWYECITDELKEFIERQHMFFVATAPASSEGEVNLSPKGRTLLHVLGPNRVAYLDYPGSGNETARHLADDDRITPIGKRLRSLHLDELPQVLNILRGDLSVVGPRPEQPRYVEELSAKLPFYDLRHLVRPGLTGWAQVKYGYAGDEQDALEKLQYEFFYLEHQDATFDLRIMLRTFRSMIGGVGRGR